MARRGAMAKNPPLRGQARRNFRQAQREAVASGGAMPTQDQFRPRPQLQSQPQPQQQSYDQARQAALGAAQQAMQQQSAPDQGGQMLPDKMYRFPGFDGAQGATLGAAMIDMPQPSANNSGKYRLSPGVYGTKEQAMKQFNDQIMQRIGAVQNQGEPMRYPGGSPNFNEAGGGQGFNLDQLNNYMPFVKGEVQDGMFRSPGVPMQNIPGMERQFQNGLGEIVTQAVPQNWRPDAAAIAKKQAYVGQQKKRRR